MTFNELELLTRIAPGFDWREGDPVFLGKERTGKPWTIFVYAPRATGRPNWSFTIFNEKMGNGGHAVVFEQEVAGNGLEDAARIAYVMWQQLAGAAP